MKILNILGATLLVSLCASTSYADVYSWKDEKGVIHFTNYSPPPAAKMVLRDIPISSRTVTKKESFEKKDLLRQEPEIEQDLEEDKIQGKRKEAEALEKEPYASRSYSPNVSGSEEAKNSYVSKYPPGFHRYPQELHLLKHHPNYHYKYHLDKPYAKKHYSAYRHTRHYNNPTIWDRDTRFHKKGQTGLHHKRVFGWQPPKAKGRPSAHYFAFGGGHYRGTSIRAKGHFGGLLPLSEAKGVLGDVAPLSEAKGVWAEDVGGDSALTRRVNCYWLLVIGSTQRNAYTTN